MNEMKKAERIFKETYRQCRSYIERLILDRKGEEINHKAELEALGIYYYDDGEVVVDYMADVTGFDVLCTDEAVYPGMYDDVQKCIDHSWDMMQMEFCGHGGIDIASIALAMVQATLDNTRLALDGEDDEW